MYMKNIHANWILLFSSFIDAKGVAILVRAEMYVAVHLFLIKDDRILLLRRYNTGFMDGQYSVIAGHVDRGESVVQAIHREAEEEAGILLAPDQLQTIQVMHRNSDTERIDYFFFVENWIGTIRNAEPSKCDDLAWFAIEALPENMIPYVRYALEQYQQGEYFTLFGWE